MYNDWIEVVRGFNVKQDIAICLFGHTNSLNLINVVFNSRVATHCMKTTYSVFLSDSCCVCHTCGCMKMDERRPIAIFIVT